MLSPAATRRRLLGSSLLPHLIRDVEPLAHEHLARLRVPRWRRPAGTLYQAFTGGGGNLSTLESNWAWVYVVRSSDKPSS